MTLYDMFFMYLKYNNILHLYKKNLSNQNNIKEIKIGTNKPSTYVILFNFNKTNEGFDFWHNIDTIWYEKILKKLKLNNKDRCYELNEIEINLFYSLFKKYKL